MLMFCTLSSFDSIPDNGPHDGATHHSQLELTMFTSSQLLALLALLNIWGLYSYLSLTSHCMSLVFLLVKYILPYFGQYIIPLQLRVLFVHPFGETILPEVHESLKV